MLREGLCRYKGMRPLSLRFRFSRKSRRSSLVLCARSKDNGRRLELQIGDSPRHSFIITSCNALRVGGKLSEQRFKSLI